MQDRLRTWRTDEMEEKYQNEKGERSKNGCPLCSSPAIETFKFWKVILNDFPYDKVASRHDMIVPLRHTSEMNDEERAEFLEIRKTYINDNYRYILEATTRTKSIPTHFHLHLLEIK